jgi:hypothetical protein
MWLAGFNLPLGARSRSLAAAMLLWCSGCGDEEAVADNHDEAGYEGDAAVERAGDAQPDEHRGADAIAQPTDEAKPDVSSGDERAADVSADAPKLALCLRLMDPQDPNHVFKLSQTVGDAYVLLVFADCRVKGAVYPDGGTPALAEWRNALYQYNPRLWGCIADPPQGFALVSTAFPDFSTADDALLIDLYLRAATTVLALTQSEVADLRNELQRLAAPLIRNESADYTLSSCMADAGQEIDALTDAGAEIDARPPADGSGTDAHNEAGTTDADASSADAGARDSGADAGEADAEEEATDASAEDEGGDN